MENVIPIKTTDFQRANSKQIYVKMKYYEILLHFFYFLCFYASIEATVFWSSRNSVGFIIELLD